MDNLTTQALVVKSLGIPPLITIIAKSKSVAAMEHAARALWHLASSTEHQFAIADAHGISPLVSMLSAGYPGVVALCSIE